jgi:xyloglucan-specific exo-beta-1,4-glucanase
MKKSISLFLLCAGIMQVLLSCQKSIRQPAGSENIAVPKDISSAKNTSTTISYTWNSVTIGGGGYVTGMVIHPTQANRMFIRTDVGGAYHWDNSSLKWVPLLDNMPTCSVDGIALDANLPDRVYVALNDGVYRSDDIGQTWAKIMSATYTGNGDLRWAGECLAVDSLTSSVIYAGTRTDGLYRSLDGGTTWAKITTVPTGNVRTVVINPASTISGRSGKVYVSVAGMGVYKSTDGGTTFAIIPGTPTAPNRMTIVDNKLYVAHSTGVTIWNGTNWNDITPPTGTGKNYCAIAIEPSNHSVIAVSQRNANSNNPLYRSSDGGVTWQQMNTTALPIVKTVEPTWWPTNWFSSATSSLAFDPLSAGSLYYTNWYGIWHSPNAMATGSINWNTQEKNHEELVVLTLAAPPSGPFLYSGTADVFGFRHDNINNYPTARLYNINEGFSVAFCEGSPANIAILGATLADGTGTLLATSANSGTSWTTHALPTGTTLGRICISSTSPDKMVYIAGGASGAVYYTANGGTSWTTATGAPAGADPATDVWSRVFPMAADCVDGNTFYIFKSGFLYASTNGGATWTQQNTTAIPVNNTFLFVAARPGTTGEVWVSLDGNGLYRSTNSGTTLTKLTTLTRSTAFSFGAPATGTSIPTAYSYGTVSGVTGMYRSTDLGATWDVLNTTGQKFPAGVKVIAGDRQVFGRVYVGTGGRGIFYGQ